MKTARSSISRVDFVRRTLAFLSMALGGPLLSKGIDRRVVVIGAGMAGIACAERLRAAGATVTVLEARERIGGRIWTDRSLGTPLDFGASWIHGTRGNPITSLADRFGIRTEKTDYESVLPFDADGKRIPDSVMEEYWGEFEKLLKQGFRRAEKSSVDMPAEAAIRKALGGEKLTTREMRLLDWFLAVLEVTSGADLSDLSTWAEDGKSYGGGDRLFPGGYDQVVRRLAEGVEIRTGHTVEAIRTTAGGLEVVSRPATVRADHVVVTVPLGVLQKHRIRFEPGLSSARSAALGQLKMGVLNKVALRFSEAFWPHERHFLGYVSARRGEFPVIMDWHRHTKEPVLLAFTGGSFARRIESQGDAELGQAILTILRKMFGAKATGLEKVMAARWSQDPFAFGSYSYVPVGGRSAAFSELSKPMGRIHFAGEATSRDYAGTVHGAYESGLRAAREIISA